MPITYYHCSLFPGKCPPTFAYYFYFDTIVASEAQCSFLWMNGTVPELPVYIRPFAGSRIFELKFEPYSADRLLNSSSLWHNFIVPTVTVRILIPLYYTLSYFWFLANCASGLCSVGLPPSLYRV